MLIMHINTFIHMQNRNRTFGIELSHVPCCSLIKPLSNVRSSKEHQHSSKFWLNYMLINLTTIHWLLIYVPGAVQRTMWERMSEGISSQKQDQNLPKKQRKTRLLNSRSMIQMGELGCWWMLQVCGLSKTHGISYQLDLQLMPISNHILVVI